MFSVRQVHAQRTAIKFSAGKYMQAGTTGFSNSYDPLALTTQNVS